MEKWLRCQSRTEGQSGKCLYRLPVKADPLPASPGISKDTVWVYLPLVDFIILYVGNYIVSSNKRWYSVSGQEMVTGPEQSELAYLNSLLVQRILSNWQFDLPIFLIALLPKPRRSHRYACVCEAALSEKYSASNYPKLNFRCTSVSKRLYPFVLSCSDYKQ